MLIRAERPEQRQLLAAAAIAGGEHADHAVGALVALLEPVAEERATLRPGQRGPQRAVREPAFALRRERSAHAERIDHQVVAG